MHLLDTDVVTALRSTRGQPAATAGALAWAAGLVPRSLFVSALTLHELEGAAVAAGKRDRAAGASWRTWLDDQVMRAFDGRVIAIDAAVVRRAAGLDHVDQRDALIAATALEHGLTLATLRPRAFKAAKVKLVDPSGFAAIAPDDDWRQASRAAPGWIKHLFVRS